MIYQHIIDKYYNDNEQLRNLLIRHSRDVANMALEIAKRHSELHINMQLLEEGAMLHDIGIFKTNAPGIYCYGTDAYIRHGIDGAILLREEGFPILANFCERHTGAGITIEEIIKQQLPLPKQDFLPQTIEEKLVCYADKFFSKSNPNHKKTLEQAQHSVAKHGQDGLKRFMELDKLFN